MAASDPFVAPAGTALLAANLDSLEALTGAWTPFTPVWTSTSGTPAIGSGTLEARYLQAGKLVIYSGRMVAAADTTFGGGGGLFSMSTPVSAQNGNLYAGHGFVIDAGTSTNNKPIGVRMDGVDAVRFYSDGGQISTSVPFTWTTSDQLHWFVVYEAA
jgi:hypothetical protein